MAGLSERSAPIEFRFRPLRTPEELREVERLQREAWGLTEEPPVPTPLQKAVQDNGGLVLGAFLDIHLVGFTFGFLGWDGQLLYHYSHMTAVRPAYQNHGVGFRLKSYQREEVLRQGLGQIRWTFDPLRSRNALLNIGKLGAVPDRYLVDYYGQMGSEANRELESDRLRAVWSLESPTVVDRLAGRRLGDREALERFRSASAIIATEIGENGLRRPVAVEEPERPTAHLEIPFDLDATRQHEPSVVRTWRHAVRDGFRAAFDLGYVVEDFVIVRAEHERRSIYLLRPEARSRSGGPSPSPPSPPPRATG